MITNVEDILDTLAQLSGEPNHLVIRAACEFFKDVPKKMKPEFIEGTYWPNGVVQQWIDSQRSDQQRPIIHLNLTSDDALETLQLIYLEQFCE